MKIKTASIVGALTLLLLSFPVFGQTNNDHLSFTITTNSVGEIKLGLTLAEALKAMSDANFRHYECDCAGDLDSLATI